MATDGNGVVITHKYKIVFVGNISVGKTSILNRFTYDNFAEEYTPTIGIDFVTKAITVNNTNIKLQLWDTAGQERFRSLIPTYIKDSSLVVIIYDLTDAESFKSVQKWADDIKEMRGDDGNTILVGNKMDATAKRAVSFDEGKAKSAEIKALSFLETSAKTGENIKELFTLVGAKLTEKSNDIPQPSVKDQPKEGEEQKQTLKVDEGVTKEKKKCAC